MEAFTLPWRGHGSPSKRWEAFSPVLVSLHLPYLASLPDGRAILKGGL